MTFNEWAKLWNRGVLLESDDAARVAFAAAHAAWDAAQNANTPTLRDQFAMAALQGLLAEGEQAAAEYDHLAFSAYELAEKMMKERSG